MAPAGRVNGALFNTAPGSGSPGPNRTHPGRQRQRDLGRDRDKGRDEERRREDGEMGRDVNKERFRAGKTRRIGDGVGERRLHRGKRQKRDRDGERKTRTIEKEEIDVRLKNKKEQTRRER